MSSSIEKETNRGNDATLLAQELANKELAAAGIPLDSDAAQAFRSNVRMFGIMGANTPDSWLNTRE